MITYNYWGWGLAVWPLFSASIENCLSNFKLINKTQKIQLRNLSSMRVSNRIIPPSDFILCFEDLGRHL